MKNGYHKELVKKLPKGWLSTLAFELDHYSKSYIQKVVYGQRNNIEILNAAVDLANKEELKVQRLEQKLKNLTS